MSGVRILYLGSVHQYNLEESFCRAFAQLGCSVSFFDIERSFLDAVAGPTSAAGRVLRRAARPLLETERAQRLWRLHANRRYDMIWCHKPMGIPHRLLRVLADTTGAKLFCFHPDHPLSRNPSHNDRHTLGLPSVVDVYFTFQRFVMDDLRRAGARRVEYLPFAYDPAIHSPPTLTEEERRLYSADLVFVGNYSRERAEWFQHVLDFDLALWGHGWDKACSLDRRFRRAWRGGSVLGRDFAVRHAAASIALNIIQCHSRSHNMRSFEAMACGAFLLSTRTDELADMFCENKEIVFFSSPAELREKVSFYLSRPGHRFHIASLGYARVRNETYVHRAQRILRVLSEL